MSSSEQQHILHAGLVAELDAAYWNSRYISGDTAWDLKMVSPPLKSYIDKLSDKNISILIPGCGNGYEAAYLYQQGFQNITLVDISEKLVDSLKERFAGTSIQIICRDFFEIKGRWDLVLEQTFFCALPPALRERYAAKMFHILKPGGTLAGLFFNREFEPDRPPFGGKREEYIALFSDLFDIRSFELCTNSIEPRKGTELFAEFIRKPLPDGSVKLYALSGMNSPGEKAGLILQLSNLPAVTMVSINRSLDEMMVVGQSTLDDVAIREETAFDFNIQLKPIVL